MRVRLASVISTSLDAILVADEQDRVLEFNGAAEKIFGFTRDEVLGAPMGDLIAPDEHWAAHVAGVKHYLVEQDNCPTTSSEFKAAEISYRNLREFGL